jgi:formate-dependent nitrite reductase membrane component NrfD
MTYYKLMLQHTPQTEWTETQLYLEMALGAVGGGLFLVSLASGGTPWGALIGFLILIGGKTIFLIGDLGKPLRFLRVLARPFGSWLSFEAWTMLVCGVSGVIWLAPAVLPLTLPPGLLLCAKFIAAVTAVILIAIDGLLMSASTGISAWSTGILAPLFAVNALAVGCGAAFLLGDQTSLLPKVNAGLVALEALILICHIAALHKGPTGARKTEEALLRGPQKFPFIFFILIGLLIPLIVLLAEFDGVTLSSPMLRCVGVLELIGAYIIRYSLLKSGMTTPVLG